MTETVYNAHTAIVIDALASLHSMREVLDEALSEAVHEIAGDPVRLCGVLLALREVRQGIAGAEAYVERAAGQAMLDNTLVCEGEWVATRHRGKERKEWDHAGLAAVLVDGALVDPESGEITGDEATAWKVRDAIMSAAGLAYWRVGVLKKAGVQVDDYCTASPGRITIAVDRVES